MSERSHKRKRSLQDSPVDLSKMVMALNRLDVLKSELDGIQETKEELDSITKHVSALEDILRGAKKPRLSFSTVTSEDLQSAGVVRKRLIFKPEKVTELAKGLSPAAEDEIVDLHSRIKKIYARVNMDRSVAILPELRIAQGKGVQITHHTSGYELWLSGNVDYAVIEYEEDEDNKDRLLAPCGSRDDAFVISKGHLVLVEAKRQSLNRTLISYIPEAVSQAIAVLKSAKDVVESSDVPLREIMQLVCEWLRPNTTGLFVLK
ncbi:hypothetical protein IEO21_06691 [Rhodonia placenta]|uniref:Uncharacterized protein n=1 Tax=Rhodonia placenta TaxID=104341 RepID=A0A8H7NZU6_9APHY|nr:hypothetical protein IEO21_06691 [Postia placenta]